VFFVAGDEVGDGDVPDAGTALGLGLGDALFEVTIALGDGDADAAAVCELDPQALSASATTAAPTARAQPPSRHSGAVRGIPGRESFKVALYAPGHGSCGFISLCWSVRVE